MSRRHPVIARRSIDVERLEGRVLLSVGLVRDVNTATAPSHAGPFTLSRGVLYFAADDGVHGRELWRTDGTAAGTRMVKDFDPRTPLRVTGDSRTQEYTEGHGDPVALTDVGGTLFFYAKDEAHGWELWKSDGTEAGTVLVKDVEPGPEGSVQRFGAGHESPLTIVAVNDTALFVPNDGGLWRSDGTEAGTFVLKQMVPGPFGPTFGPSLASTGTTAFFSAYDAATGFELWRTDGTPAGTRLVRDLVPGPAGSEPARFVPVGDTLFFTAYDRAVDPRRTGPRALWKSDGTPEGTERLLPAGDGSNGSPAPLGPVGGRLFFVWQDGNARTWLGTSDGRPGGTHHMVKEVAFNGGPGPLVDLNGVAYFAAAEATPVRLANPDIELWRSDGTAAGTHRVKDVNPGPEPSSPRGLTVVDGTLYFAASVLTPDSADDADERMAQVWKSDGSEAGTVPLRDVSVWDHWSGPTFVKVGDTIVFPAAEPRTGLEPWRTDGTPQGTSLLFDVNRVTLDSVRGDGDTAVVGGAILFVAEDADHGRALWKTDGTEAGTVLVKDVLQFGDDVDEWNLTPRFLTEHDGAAYFFAGDRTTGLELWKSDGTPEGTVLVKDVWPGPRYDTHGPLVSLGGWLYFVASDGVHGPELWKTDGTTAGTVMVRDIDPRTTTHGMHLVGLARVGERLFFQADDGAHGWDLWTSDGTEAGTVLVKDTLPGPLTSTSQGNITDFNGVAVFGDEDGVHGMELWRSDGTAAGSYMLKDVWEGERMAYPQQFTVVGQTLYFMAFDGRGGRRLWRSDGTPQGTQPTDLEQTNLEAMTAFEGSLYFSPYTGGLYRTDGTAAGTVLLAPDVKARAMTPFAGKLYVSAAELWVTDGTPQGTRQVADIRPGPPGSRPSPLTVAGDVAVFFADDVAHGREPWRVVPEGTVAGRHVFYDGASRASGAPIATDKTPLLRGQTASFSNVTSYTRGINGVVIDVARPAGAEPLRADDFVFRKGPAATGSGWEAAPAPRSITVQNGAGSGGSDRVTLTWGDDAVTNGWLQVTVRPTPRTGLSGPDVFTFGNLVGLAGQGGGGALQVTALDLAAVRRALGTVSALTSRFDFDRDGRINALDLAAVRRNLNRSLPIPPATAALTFPVVQHSGAFSAGRVTDESEGWLLD